ncbi:uncharacterized protein LOC135157207, partial [Lytechinus pictus]|uniref:uncharacterized protein LOC135157207 n=1 Tax=Lytechinus pictus TaxID=7653 RepID=UPI0030BA064A
MSNQLAKNAKGSSRKRKFDTRGSSREATLSTETLSASTSPLRSDSDEDAIVELDFQSGNVSFHAKRHKLFIPPSEKTAVTKDLVSVIPSEETHGDDNSTRMQCRPPLTYLSCDNLSPIKNPSASLPAILTLSSSMLMPADNQLTCLENQDGDRLPGVLKQSLSSSSQEIPLATSHQSIVCHPSLLSPSYSTSQSSGEKKLICSGEGNVKEAVSSLIFVDDYYSAMDVCNTGEDLVGDMPKESLGEMECEQLQSYKTSNYVPNPLEQSRLVRVVGSKEEELCEGLKMHCDEIKAKDIELYKSNVRKVKEVTDTGGSSDNSVKDIPNEPLVTKKISYQQCENEAMIRTDDSIHVRTVSETKTSPRATSSKDHSQSLVKQTLKGSSTSEFGKMLPRSVALHVQSGNIGPSQMRRAIARDKAQKEPRQPSLKSGKALKGCKLGTSSKVKGQSVPVLEDSATCIPLAGEEEMEDSDSLSSKELTDRTGQTMSEEDKMETDDKCRVDHVHGHEHDVIDSLVTQDEMMENEGKKDESFDGEGSSIPRLPESYSDLQESGLAAIDLFS